MLISYQYFCTKSIKHLEINNFGGAHGKNLDLRVHTVGAHGRGRVKTIDLAVCTLKSIKIAQINKNERNQQFWCDQMKRPQMSEKSQNSLEAGAIPPYY